MPHPLPPARRRPGALLVLLLLPAFVVLAGCGEGEREAFYSTADAPFRESPAGRDSALAVLDTLRQEAMRTAFARLSSYRFTRHLRTEQLEGDTVVAFTARTLRYQEGQPSTLLDETSEGSFSFGLLGQLVSIDPTPEEAPPDAASYLLPEEPAYLATRSREAYRYRLLPDTLLSDRQMLVIEARVQPDEASRQSIRHARLYVDRETKALVAALIERSDHTALFREDSRLFIALAPAPDEGWVPHTVRVHTRMALPLRPSQHFRTISTYYDYSLVR